MTSKLSILTKIGLILALIGGILAIIGGIFVILGSPFIGSSFLSGIVGGIIAIICGAALVLIYMEKIQLEGLVLGIVVLVLGIIGAGGWLSLAGIGGILIIIDQFV